MLAIGRALMVGPAAAAARRAVARARPADGRAHRPGHPRDPRAGHGGACSSSRTPRWRWRSPTTPRCSRSGGSRCRGPRPSWPRSEDVQRLYLGGHAESQAQADAERDEAQAHRPRTAGAVAMDGVAPLVVDDVTLRFGGITALDAVSFTVEPGSVHALIGPNGAGKSSCFNVISGLYRPTAGAVRLGETELTALRPHRLAGLGVGRTFQNIALSPGSDRARQRHARPTPPHPRRLPRLRPAAARRRAERRHVARVEEICAFLGIARPARRARRRRCPTAPPSASTSPGRSRASPRCCCSTSPSPGMDADRDGRDGA